MTEPEPQQPDEQIGYLLVRLAHTLSRRWTHDLAAHGLTARQHGVLAALAAQPGISAGALARTVMITAQGMGQLLTGLQQRGLVARQEPTGRGRPAHLTVTGEGHRILAEVRPIIEAHNSPATLGLTDDDAALLRTLLRRVHAATGDAEDPTVDGA
jgi:DNA-binding MarR family transcriptional regulator